MLKARKKAAHDSEIGRGIFDKRRMATAFEHLDGAIGRYFRSRLAHLRIKDRVGPAHDGQHGTVRSASKPR